MRFLKDFNVNKLLFISSLTLFSVIINSYSLKSQIIDNEQAPSNVKWRQINHKKFQLQRSFYWPVSRFQRDFFSAVVAGISGVT